MKGMVIELRKVTKRIIAVVLAVMVIVISSAPAFALTACSDCERIFENYSAYEVHKKVCKPSGTKKITYICSYCEAEFGKQVLLADHVGVCPMKPAFPQKGNSNMCANEGCSEIFEDENAYNNHIQLCREVFTCNICSKEYTNNEFRLIHQVACIFIPPETEPSVEIKNNPGSKKIKYGDELVLTVEANNLPSGATVVWVADGGSVEIEVSADGKSCRVKGVGDGKSTVFVRAKNADGTPVRDTYGTEAYDTEVVEVDGNFFQKIISFFKDLFRMDRTVTQ